MEKVTCPYCDVDVSMEAVEKEGGACPECGAMITGSLLFAGANYDDDADDLDDDLDDDV